MPKEFEVIKDVAQNNAWFKILTISAIALIAASWFVPPMAIIDGSVLAATGELLAFGALWVVVKAVDKGTPATMTHGGTTITVNKKRNGNEDAIVRPEEQYEEEKEENDQDTEIL